MSSDVPRPAPRYDSQLLTSIDELPDAQDSIEADVSCIPVLQPLLLGHQPYITHERCGGHLRDSGSMRYG